jgi:lipid A 4'-phosphatase
MALDLASAPNTSRRSEVRWVLGLFLCLALVFRCFPEIDLWAASLFYAPERGFFSPDNWWLAIPYFGMPILAQFMVWGILLGWLAAWRLPKFKAWRVVFAFLFCSALLGPHLLVGEVLKDHVGRARPSDVQQFGGKLTFTPAFVLSNQCDKNCSFVSAHVASAAFVMAFGWLSVPVIRRRWLWAGVGFAAVLGLARMAQGGHFLSDVIFPVFAVYAGLWLTEWLFRWRGWLPTPNVPKR